jgi:hypothetical protein
MKLRLSAQLNASLTTRMLSLASSPLSSATFTVAALSPAEKAPLRADRFATGDEPRSASKTTVVFSAEVNAAFSSAVPGSDLGRLGAEKATEADATEAKEAGGEDDIGRMPSSTTELTKSSREILNPAS